MKDDALEEKVQKLNFGIELSMRYHQRCRGFFDSKHKLIMFFIVISGSAAFSGLPNYFAAVATVLAAIDLLWSPSHRARDHELLFRRFNLLAADLRSGDLSEENYAKWKKERIMIEADEPPVYIALANDCFNEVNRSRDSSAKLIEIGWWPWLTMNWFRHSETRFQEAKSSA